MQQYSFLLRSLLLCGFNEFSSLSRKTEKNRIKTLIHLKNAINPLQKLSKNQINSFINLRNGINSFGRCCGSIGRLAKREQGGRGGRGGEGQRQTSPHVPERELERNSRQSFVSIRKKIS